MGRQAGRQAGKHTRAACKGAALPCPGPPLPSAAATPWLWLGAYQQQQRRRRNRSAAAAAVAAVAARTFSPDNLCFPTRTLAKPPSPIFSMNSARGKERGGTPGAHIDVKPCAIAASPCCLEGRLKRSDRVGGTSRVLAHKAARPRFAGCPALALSLSPPPTLPRTPTRQRVRDLTHSAEARWLGKRQAARRPEKRAGSGGGSRRARRTELVRQLGGV